MTTAAAAAVPLPVDPAQLPDDPALLKAMLVEVLQALHDSQRDGAQLQARLDALLRRLYGPRAERFDPNQPLLFPDLLPTPPPASPPPPEVPADRSAATRRRPGHGRQPLPAHLPRQRRVHDLTDAERLCPCCGQPRTVLGQDVSEQLEYIPASLLVIEHIRLRYACLACEKDRAAAAAAEAPPTSPPPVVDPAAAATPPPAADAAAARLATPEPPPAADPAAAAPATPPADAAAAAPMVQPIPASTFVTAPRPAAPLPGGLPGPGLLAHLIVSKFGDHLPLYRLEQIFARQGVALPRQTQCDWLAAGAALLQPLYALLVERLWQSWVVGSDDTPVAVLQPGRGQTRTGRVWVYVGDVFAPYHVYAYTPNREQEGPQDFLRAYQGYFQADAYGGYDALYATGRLVEVGCWAHARRKFYDARATDPARATYGLAVIRQLYAVERQADTVIAAQGLGREEGWWLRLQLRQEQAVPLLVRLQAWLEEQRPQVLPKSPIGEAIGYASNQWDALWRYTSQGYLPIDNNAAERALRAIAVGRKNYLFFGSDAGGRTAAVLYSFVQTCRGLSIEPWRYLRDVLERLPSWPAERLAELLPDRWAAAQRAAVAELPVSAPPATGRSPPATDTG